MSVKTSHRVLAAKQRRRLERDGFTPAEIREFARLMNPQPELAALPPCEQLT